MLDSGHYELNEAKKRAAMVESLMTNRIKTPPRYSPPISEMKKSFDQSYRYVVIFVEYQNVKLLIR